MTRYEEKVFFLILCPLLIDKSTLNECFFNFYDSVHTHIQSHNLAFPSRQ